MATRRGGKWDRISMTVRKDHKHISHDDDLSDMRERDDYVDQHGVVCGARITPMHDRDATNWLCLL